MVGDVIFMLIFAFFVKVKMKKIIILFALISLLVAACSKRNISTDAEIDKNSLSKKQGLLAQDIQATISINMPELKNSAEAQIKLQGSDTIFIDIFGPFGIKLGTLWSDRNQFVFLNYFQSYAYVGTPSAENFKMSAQIDMSFDDLISIFRAEPIADISEYEQDLSNDSNLLFKRKVNDEAEFLLVDPTNNTIKQYQRQNSSGESVLKIFLENYKNYSEFLLPDKINVNLPLENGSVTFELKKRLINTVLTNISKPELPSSFKTIDLDKLN